MPNAPIDDLNLSDFGCVNCRYCTHYVNRLRVFKMAGSTVYLIINCDQEILNDWVQFRTFGGFTTDAEFVTELLNLYRIHLNLTSFSNETVSDTKLSSAIDVPESSSEIVTRRSKRKQTIVVSEPDLPVWPDADQPNNDKPSPRTRSKKLRLDNPSLITVKRELDDPESELDWMISVKKEDFGSDFTNDLTYQLNLPEGEEEFSGENGLEADYKGNFEDDSLVTVVITEPYQQKTVKTSKKTKGRKAKRKKTTGKKKKYLKGWLSNDVGNAVCGQCGKEFMCSATLKLHIKYHDLMPTYACSYCNFNFLDKRRRDLHDKKHQGFHHVAMREKEDPEEPVPDTIKPSGRLGKGVRARGFCPICGKVVRLCNMPDHLKLHKDQSPIEPENYGKFFESNEPVKRRRKKYCELCCRSFMSYHTLDRHKKYHDDMPCYSCSYCKFSFMSKTTRDRHEAMHQSQNHVAITEKKDENRKGPWWKKICGQCGKEFMCANSLKTHLKFHDKMPCYDCSYCNFSFVNANIRNLHERTHLNHNHVAMRERDDPVVTKWNIVCDQCGKEFMSFSTLRLHLKFHDELPCYSCSYCNFSFVRKVKRNMHERYHLNQNHVATREREDPEVHKRKRICKLCGKQFMSANALKTHLKFHDIMPSYSCSYCNFSFARKGTRDRHENMHQSHNHVAMREKRDEEGPLSDKIKVIKGSGKGKNIKCSCNICGKVVRLASANHHLSLHDKLSEFELEYGIKRKKRPPMPNKDEPAVCNLCDKQFMSEYSLKQHQKHHTNPCFRCAYCVYHFMYRNKWEIHENNHRKYNHVPMREADDPAQDARVHFDEVHTGEGLRIVKSRCKVCGKVVNKYGLVKHLETHEDPMKRRLECKLCGQFYIGESSLYVHMRNTHGDQNRYMCDVCGKGFSVKGKLTRHARTHTDEKRYQCSFCDKRFNDFTNMRQHENVHIGIKNYKCEYCSKAFAQCSALIQHKRQHTGFKVRDKLKEKIAQRGEQLMAAT